MSPVNREAASRSGEHIGFSFGENWQKFLGDVSQEQLDQAQESLVASFSGAELTDRSFLDLGCGSGVFSLAARRLGANVTSVDVDPASVACTESLRQDDKGWDVRQQSILEPEGLPTVDMLYSWGVLHHTGAMWEAVDKALALVKPGGLACIALYNHPTRVEWHMRLKRLYNRLPAPGRVALRYAYGLRLLVLTTLIDRRNPIRYIRDYGKNSRGMSFWSDVDDWLGGLPCEFAEPDEVVAHLPAGYDLKDVRVRPPGACNEYLITRAGTSELV